jgi:ribonuclease HI
MTQSMAYRGIKEMHKPVSRIKTDENVRTIQEAVKNEFSYHPKLPAIWKSIRHKDIGRNIRNFLWKSMHDAHRAGKYWLNIPECEDRANCVHCGAVESLEHILLECPSPGQSEIWKLAEELWTKNIQTGLLSPWARSWEAAWPVSKTQQGKYSLLSRGFIGY